MKNACLALFFLGLWSSALPGAGSPAPDLRSYRDSPTTLAKEQIAAYARLHAKEESGGLASFALGMTAFNQKNYSEAILFLKAAQPLLPRLADYLAYYIAASKAQLNDDSGVSAELAPLHAMSGPLSLASRLLEAKALVHAKVYADAIRILRERIDSLPQPDADSILAQAYEGQGSRAEAAVFYQRIYYSHPGSSLALDAATAIERLKAAMGASYPSPTPKQLLMRGDYWLTKKNYAKARVEFQEMLPQLGGLERDQASVGFGAAELLGGSADAGAKYLKDLRLAHSEADAERDYYLGEAGLADLERNYPASPWRLKSLVALANSFMKERQTDRAIPLFRAAAGRFPADAVTAAAHWQVAWQAYLARTPEAAALLREQLEQYPQDQHAASALYFLGRMSEEGRDAASARAYYERLQAVFPHYYYGTLASQRLTDSALAAATASAEVSQMLDRIKFAQPHEIALEAPTPASIAHIERARLLTAAGFPDWAETEIRFGAATDGQRSVLALELAKSDPTLALSLRHMKVFTPDYLALDYDRAPKEIWGYLFPLPLQQDLEKAAKESNLDPFLVAGLIRQESEFNPVVVSRAHALGLMQLMPSTGSMLARKQGIAPFNSAMLLDPLVSLKLGTTYLRAQLDRFNGNLEQTLAAYNAGPGRVAQWTANAHFREPAEFVESIPFSETREYVQSVLRNAAVYRQLYADRTPPPQPRNALTSTHVSAPVPKRPVARKRAG